MKAITAKKPAGITPNAPLQEFYSRVLAYMFIAALIAAGTYTGFFSYSLLWVVPYALLYPHLAYFFTSRFKTHYPKLTYAIELCVDSVHAGTVLALIGYAIDRHPKAKLFLEENLRLNNLCKLPFRHGQWGEHPVPSTKDTGAALLTKKYDLVIGSDLLYEPDMPKALARFIDGCANPNAEVWIDQRQSFEHGARISLWALFP